MPRGRCDRPIELAGVSNTRGKIPLAKHPPGLGLADVARYGFVSKSIAAHAVEHVANGVVVQLVKGARVREHGVHKGMCVCVCVCVSGGV